ncbi:glycosyltransferase [Vibrio parahaemolyticus]|nr:glycosyltransferase [Vibrio parahaemolyticus]MDF4670396.1 glycosyltransferase [Vibrio parahaemolyticus]HAV1413279.1 glycosyltransferase [Vibrio parahaemolyticus]HAV2006198.1 glycosyltransferase [Vibrio parahaemolyticus]
MKKISIVDSSLGPGGAEKLIVEMAPIMRDKGYDVEVLILTSYGDVFSEQLLKNDIKVKFFQNKASYWSIKYVFDLYKSLKNSDAVYTHVIQSRFFTAIACLFLSKKIRLITTEHNTHNRRRDIKLFRYIDRLIYSKYDKVISITDQVEHNLLNHLKSKKTDKYIVIPNGVDLDKFNNSSVCDRSDFGFSSDDFIILMIGRFAPAKDQRTLINSLKFLPNDFKLLLVGNGESINEHKQFVKENKLVDRVKFIDFHSDIPEIIKMCDLGVLSSFWEGMPISALEKMASGIPFLGSDVPGINDLLSIENKEMLFQQGNMSELAEKIIKIKENKDYRIDNINRGLNISNKYSLHNMVDQYLQCIEK